MTITGAMRFSFLLAASTWLSIAGVIVPRLFAMEYGQGDLAACHVLILSAIALAAIIFLTKPAASTTKAKP